METKELEELIIKHCGDDYTVNIEELVMEVAKLSHNNAIRLASEKAIAYKDDDSRYGGGISCSVDSSSILKLLIP